MRPNAMGSVEPVAWGHGGEFGERELEAELRRTGSDGVVNRVANTLGVASVVHDSVEPHWWK